MSLLSALFGAEKSADVLITDVTRMQADRVCIAGLRGRETVRLAEPPPTNDMLATFGGLAPGDVVRVDARPVRRYRPPHREDSTWLPSTVLKIDSLSGPRIYDRLSATAFDSIIDAFGKAKYFSARGNPAFPTDRGSRSLATVLARDVRIYKHGDGLRADFSDSAGDWKMLPVEGLAIRDHFRRCRSCSTGGEVCIARALLRVGLGRPFKPDDQEPGCFAQVNSVISPQSGIELHEGALL